MKRSGSFVDVNGYPSAEKVIQISIIYPYRPNNLIAFIFCVPGLWRSTIVNALARDFTWRV